MKEQLADFATAVMLMHGSLLDALKGWQGIIAVTAVVFMAGIGFQATFGNLPGHEKRLGALEDWRVAHDREFEALVCLITLPDSIASNSRARTRECGL